MGGLIFIINNRRNPKIRKKDKENNLDFNRYFIMKKIVLYILLMLGSSPFLKGENGPMSQNEQQDRIFSFFSDIESRHEEKLWLHLDKPYYAAGDTIRFRAYLSDAMTLCPDTLSNFIYVDLFDRRNKLISSKKIKRDSVGFANNLYISDTLSAGEYTLQAYTGWMLNFDPSCFFQKNILIGRTASDIRTDITYTDKDMMVIRFSDKSGSPLFGNEASYELFDRNGKQLSSGQQPTSPSGALFVTLPTDSTLNGAYAETRLKLGNGTLYKRTFFPEPRTASFDIQFLPEGGNLVPGTPQIVAFKAVQSNGYPAEVRGAILNSAGDTVARFSSEHDGMGIFLLTPQSAETYRAVTFCDTLSVSTPLPSIHENACALTVTQSENNLRYRVLGTIPEGSVLVAHTRGLCHFVHSVPPNNPEGLIKTDSLPEGILHLLLADSSGIPKTERLVYLSRPQEQWQVTQDKPSYGKREKVRIDITVGKGGQPLEGTFSVSVTDANTVKTDSLSDNIRTNLLLTSDLKGYIHNPGYYFLDDSPARRHYLDLVMMTHGWRRFKTDDLFHPEPFTPKHYIERGQYISGYVSTAGGKVAKQASVTAFAFNKDNVVGSTVTDSMGRFLIEGLDFQDSTVFFISSKNKRGGRIPCEVKADKLYSGLKFKPLHPFFTEDSLRSRSDDLQRYLASFPKPNNDGLGEYELEEVTVTAKDPNRPAVAIYKKIIDDTARIAKFGSMSLEHYIKFLPGVVNNGDWISLRSPSGFSYPAQIRIDNEIIYGMAQLYRFFAKEVDYFKLEVPSIMNPPLTPRAIFWDNYPCRLHIFLREDVNGIRNFVVYRTNGYAKHTEFYHPVYDAPERLANKTPDRRTTLYWEPYLRIGDDGKGTIEFYTNDKDKSRLEVVIEGIATDGSVCRTLQRLE